MYTLVIGNKNYSSWSLRPWLILKEADIAFQEIALKLFTDDFEERIGEYSPTRRVPVLRHGEHVIWDSLAIAESLNETHPEKQLWPQDPSARNLARSVSCEMHSGFFSLREKMPMNCRATNRKVKMDDDLQSDIDRIIKIWEQCRERFATTGDWLFGDFSIADAMYAPVAFRFSTYQVKLPKLAKEYCDFLLSRPAMQEWKVSACSEIEVITAGEVG